MKYVFDWTQLLEMKSNLHKGFWAANDVLHTGHIFSGMYTVLGKLFVSFTPTSYQTIWIQNKSKKDCLNSVRNKSYHDKSPYGDWTRDLWDTELDWILFSKLYNMYIGQSRVSDSIWFRYVTVSQLQNDSQISSFQSEVINFLHSRVIWLSLGMIISHIKGEGKRFWKPQTLKLMRVLSLSDK